MKYCGACGEPITAHGTRELTVQEEMAVDHNARNPQQMVSGRAAARRVCPVKRRGRVWISERRANA